MNEIAEHMGSGLLELAAAAGMMVFISGCIRQGGSLNYIVTAYVHGLCG